MSAREIELAAERWAEEEYPRSEYPNSTRRQAVKAFLAGFQYKTDIHRILGDAPYLVN